MTGTLALLGAGTGLGLAVIIWGLVPPRRALTALIADRRRRAAAPTGPVYALAGGLHRLGWPTTRLITDLRVCDIDPAVHVARQVTLALLGFAAPAALSTALHLLAGNPGWIMPAWVCTGAAALGFVVPNRRVHQQARLRRDLMTHTLSALLDLIGPALAAGSGVEQAMRDTASIASGWAADRVRDALDTARAARLPLWEPLDDLGTTVDVIALRQLAASLRLAAGEGTRIRDAIAVRADALSQHQAAALEARAAADTEKMSAPLMILAGLLALFLILAAIGATTTIT